MLAKLYSNVPNILLSKEQQRRKYLASKPSGALLEYLSTPFANKNQCIGDLELLSLDFETTGLDPVKEQLLSIGSVDVAHGKISLSGAYHQIIKTVGQLQKENVAIHQITDAEKERGAELKAELDRLLRAMSGKVVVVHFAKIERSFLQQACKQMYGLVPPFVMIDTLAISKRRFDNQHIKYKPSDLRLPNLRAQFKLPAYHGHNALSDAIATAELLLAELQHHHQGLETPLKQLL